jgi:hypothetical protein
MVSSQMRGGSMSVDDGNPVMAIESAPQVSSPMPV